MCAWLFEAHRRAILKRRAGSWQVLEVFERWVVSAVKKCEGLLRDPALPNSGRGAGEGGGGEEEGELKALSAWLMGLMGRRARVMAR